MEAAKKYMSIPEPSRKEVVPMVTEEDIGKWESFDDSFQGGSSESKMELLEDGSGCAIVGNLVMDVGIQRTQCFHFFVGTISGSLRVLLGLIAT